MDGDKYMNSKYIFLAIFIGYAYYQACDMEALSNRIKHKTNENTLDIVHRNK